jgi:hypothetical protein
MLIWWKSEENRSFFLGLAVIRMRSSACDTLSRSCARHVLCWPAFPLVPVLRSTNSAADCSALFAGFSATTLGSDFPRSWPALPTAHATLATRRPASALPGPDFHRLDCTSFGWRLRKVGLRRKVILSARSPSPMRSRQGLGSCTPRLASPASGVIKTSTPKPVICSRRSTAGSPKGSIRRS